jgi:hypothetical protein
MSKNRHAKQTASATVPPPPDRAVLPHWLPVGDAWNSLPEPVRHAVPILLVPAYRRFVLDVSDELQRSVGLTLVHLLWLEICTQTSLAEVVANPLCLAATLNNPNQMIDRHLNLVAAKSQTTELLTKLRLVNEALARSAPPALPAPQPVITLDHGHGPNFHPSENGTASFDAPTSESLAPRPSPLAGKSSLGELERQSPVDQQPAPSSAQTPRAAATTREMEKQGLVDQQEIRGVQESLALYQQARRDFPAPSDFPSLPQAPVVVDFQPVPSSSRSEDDTHV